MSKVIGTIPNRDFPKFKEYIVEYNGDWYIGSSTVYHSINGFRPSHESELSAIVNSAEIQIAAGRLKLKHYTYEEMLNEYDEFSKKQSNIDTKNSFKFIVGVVILILLSTLPFYFR